MEKHSSTDPIGRISRTRGIHASLPAGESHGSVMCTCPVRPERVCNVKGCTTRLSRYNRLPLCNSCRMVAIPKRRSSAHPRDMDGKVHDPGCPINYFNQHGKVTE